MSYAYALHPSLPSTVPVCLWLWHGLYYLLFLHRCRRDPLDASMMVMQRWRNAAPMLVLGSHDWNKPDITGEVRALQRLPPPPPAC